MEIVSEQEMYEIMLREGWITVSGGDKEKRKEFRDELRRLARLGKVLIRSADDSFYQAFVMVLLERSLSREVQRLILEATGYHVCNKEFPERISRAKTSFCAHCGDSLLIENEDPFALKFVTVDQFVAQAELTCSNCGYPVYDDVPCRRCENPTASRK